MKFIANFTPQPIHKGIWEMRIKKSGTGMREQYTSQWPYFESMRTATGNEVPSIASSNEEEADQISYY
jgi:hypothetical protein